jgi:hypothetical protein
LKSNNDRHDIDDKLSISPKTTTTQTLEGYVFIDKKIDETK